MRSPLTHDYIEFIIYLGFNYDLVVQIEPDYHSFGVLAALERHT